MTYSKKMLQVEKGKTNNLVTTVTELTTIENAFYLFEFINDQNNEKSYAVLRKETSPTCRFDSFTLIEPTDVSFEVAGYYSYNIYQQDNNLNLDPELSEGLVEKGRLKVIETESSGTEYENDNTSVIYGE